MATASFLSHDAELADLALGSTPIALAGQVNNYTAVALLKSGAATLTHVGDVYTLDFGHLALGAGDRIADLSVLNSAIGPADLLGGAFDLSGLGNGFDVSGFDPFAGIVAGASHDGLQVVFDDAAAGAFSATLVLHATGSNTSGYSGRLDDTTLVLRGEVASVAAIPEPETYALMLGGLMVVIGTRRMRRRQRCAAQRQVGA
jgi:hypothetical protein